MIITQKIKWNKINKIQFKKKSNKIILKKKMVIIIKEVMINR